MIDYHLAEVLVTDRAVYFDGQELPWYIAKDGVSFKPGGFDDIGRLTIEFLVEDVRFTLREPPCYSIDYEASKWERLRRDILAEINAQHGLIERIVKEYT